MVEQGSASGSMARESHTATQLPTATVGVSGCVSRTLSKLQ